MKEVPNASVHLVITSPPYNVTKTYDQNLTLQEYLALIEGMITECIRVLVPNGIIAINIANVGRKPYIPLDGYVIQLLLNHQLTVFQEIIWDKEASAGGSCAWGSWQSASNPSLRDIHEYIILGIKAESIKNIQFPLESVGDFPQSVENKKMNITPKELLTNFWEFSTESAKRVNHPAPFPVELPLRLIKLFSKTGDIILDPFMGSGTVAIASLLANRYYIGYEINAEFIQTAQDRIENFRNANRNTTLDSFLGKRRKSNAAH
jgi:site-specific DNA-methyltransferase (adenine-specific)